MQRLPSAAPSSTLPSSSTSSGLTPKNGRVAEPGLEVGRAGQRRDHDAAGLGLPPGVDDRAACLSPTTLKYHSQASGLIGSPTEPSTRSDLREVFFTWLSPAPISARMRGRRGVEDVDLVLVDDLPEARRRGIVRHALEHQRGGAVGERPVDDVAVAGDPADIGRAPVDVAVMVVEDILVGHRGDRRDSRRWCAARPSACRSSPRCRG